MRKLRLDLEHLSVESFDTTRAKPGSGTVYGEQCTCYTACTCPGCPTCDASCNGTCGDTCAASCGGTCAGATCAERCATGEPDTCVYTWCFGVACQ